MSEKDNTDQDRVNNGEESSEVSGGEPMGEPRGVPVELHEERSIQDMVRAEERLMAEIFDMERRRWAAFDALFPGEDSSLVAFAERQLRKNGFYDDDAPYGSGALAQQILRLVRAFSAQHHSGGTAEVVIGVTERLLRREPLDDADKVMPEGAPDMRGVTPPEVCEACGASAVFWNEDLYTILCHNCGTVSKKYHPDGGPGGEVS